LHRLKNDLQMFTAALAELKQEKDNLQARACSMPPDALETVVAYHRLRLREIRETTPEASEAANGADDLGGTPHPFDTRPDLEALASEQGVEPVDDFDALLGDFWPEDEGADEFVTTLREWRRDALDA
jgi:hypothetical protein